MQGSLASWFRVSPEAFWQWGRLMLWGGLAFALLILAFLAWALPEALPFVPLVLIAGAGAWWLFQRPFLNLCVVLAGMSVILRYEAGIQVTEILFGLYYLAFLAHWFVTRLVVYREPILRRPEDKALLLFLIGMTLSVVLTILYDGVLKTAFSEWIALSILGFYFPIKEASVREKHGLKIIFAIVCGLALYAAFLNLLEYRAGLQSAVHMWQVVRGRVVTNDNLMMASSLLTLVLVVFVRTWRARLGASVLFLLCFASLIFTQSRGYWAAFLFGAFVMFVLVDRRRKGWLLALGGIGGVAVFAAGVLVLGDTMFVIMSSLASRFASISTAIFEDVSLRARFVEAQAAFEHIKTNPILGHGLGVEYRFYFLPSKTNVIRTFIHNGYVSLWYRFGLWGLGLVMFVWGAGIWRGIQVFRQQAAPYFARVVGLGAASALAAFLLSANTSNPLYLSDATFIITALLGLAGGAYARSQHVALDREAAATS